MEHTIEDTEAVRTAGASLSPSPSPSPSRPVGEHGGEGGHEGSSVAQAGECGAVRGDDEAVAAVGAGDKEPAGEEGGGRGKEAGRAGGRERGPEVAAAGIAARHAALAQRQEHQEGFTDERRHGEVSAALQLQSLSRGQRRRYTTVAETRRRQKTPVRSHSLQLPRFTRER